jgi:hypothetical protein
MARRSGCAGIWTWMLANVKWIRRTCFWGMSVTKRISASKQSKHIENSKNSWKFRNPTSCYQSLFMVFIFKVDFNTVNLSPRRRVCLWIFSNLRLSAIGRKLRFTGTCFRHPELSAWIFR